MDGCVKCRSGFTCPEHGGRWDSVNRPLPLIGYARTITDNLAAAIHPVEGYECGKLKETRRGGTFEVRLVDADGPTDFFARVTIELDRVENP